MDSLRDLDGDDLLRRILDFDSRRGSGSSVLIAV